MSFVLWIIRGGNCFCGNSLRFHKPLFKEVLVFVQIEEGRGGKSVALLGSWFS